MIIHSRAPNMTPACANTLLTSGAWWRLRLGRALALASYSGSGCALTLMGPTRLTARDRVVTEICGFMRVGVASALATNSDSPRFLLSSAWQIGVLRLMVRCDRLSTSHELNVAPTLHHVLGGIYQGIINAVDRLWWV